MTKDALLNQAIDSLLETLPSTWGRIRTQIRENAIKGHGISLIQFHILRHSRRGIDTAAALAAHLQISRPAVSQAVEGLVQKGLLERTPSLADRRQVFLQPSAAGLALLEEAIHFSQAWMAEQMGTLDPADLQALLTAMQILREAYQIPPKAKPAP